MRLPARSLERLLRPRSVAVFGRAQAEAVIGQCLKMGFNGEIWPVHPERQRMNGLTAYPSIEALPGAPDAAFVGVNRHATVGIVRQLAAAGAGGAICYAAGFREAGAAALEEELLEAAGEMPIIGPNCYGLINYCDGALLWPDQHGGRRLKAGERGAAIVLQSSNIAINLTMQRRGLPIAHIVTAGNQAQTGLSELAGALIEDERVSVLGLHVEAFDSVSGFERLASRARQLGKPIVALKIGRSDQARQAAISHTASLSGSDAAASAFLARLGIARVGSLPAFCETLKLLHVHGPLPGTRLSSMSCSGGEAGLIADAAAGRKVRFSPVEPDRETRLREALGPIPAIANPLDYHTFVWNDPPAMTRVFEAMLGREFDLNLLVLDFPRPDRCADADWRATAASFRTALKRSGARGAVVATLAENMGEAHAEALIDAGIAPLCGIDEALDAIEAAAAIGTAWSGPVPAPLPALRASARSGRWLDEAEAKHVLRGAGMSVPAGERARTPAEAVAAAERLGYPVALKALGIAHKTEAGAVRLHLANSDEVRAAAHALAAIGPSLYVERMIDAPVAELIVGITRDAALGPVLTIGTGGVLAELLADVRTLLLPATEPEIRAALQELQLFALLDGYRGRVRADIDAAIAAIARIGERAVADRIVEMDINPLILCAAGQGAWVADALLMQEENS